MERCRYASITAQTLSDRLGFRSDPELQGLRHRAERALGYLADSRSASRDSHAVISCSKAASSLISSATIRSFGVFAASTCIEVGTAHPPESRDTCARRFPGARHDRLPLLVFRGVCGTARDRGVGARGCRAGRAHLRHRARVRLSVGRSPLDKRVPAGYGKVAVLEELQHQLGVTPDRVIYVGDGSSDVHVMLHVNNRDGFTIAVSENKQLAGIAKSTC